MNNEFIFSNLEEYVIEKENITTIKNDNKKWQLISYKSSICEGNMLVAKESVHPQNVTLKLGLEGRYHIYVGLLNDGWDDYLHIKTTSQEYFTGVCFNRRTVPSCWSLHENF